MNNCNSCGCPPPGGPHCAADPSPTIAGGAGLTGRVHSLETLGAADGPGLRLIIFLQGCPLGCRYCHNPDSWPPEGGTVYAVSELVRRALRYQPYYGERGGVTLSGGEPLLQAEFTAALLAGLRAAGLSTALDTSGWLPVLAASAPDSGIPAILRDILARSDRVILDVKSPDPAQFRWLTGRDIGPLRRFLDACAAAGNWLWIRQVIVPGWNDQPENIRQLADFIHQWPALRLEKIELLPYHTLGEAKWHKLDRPYPLAGLPPMGRQALQGLQELADRLIRIESPAAGQ